MATKSKSTKARASRARAGEFPEHDVAEASGPTRAAALARADKAAAKKDHFDLPTNAEGTEYFAADEAQARQFAEQQGWNYDKVSERRGTAIVLRKP